MPGQHDQRRRRVRQLVGDRQQHGDGRQRPDARQHADGRAEEHADEAVHQVFQRAGGLESRARGWKGLPSGICSLCLAGQERRPDRELQFQALDEHQVAEDARARRTDSNAAFQVNSLDPIALRRISTTSETTKPRRGSRMAYSTTAPRMTSRPRQPIFSTWVSGASRLKVGKATRMPRTTSRMPRTMGK